MHTIKALGIAYDLDGTIISTLSLHEDGWKYAGAALGVAITDDFLFQQRGITNDAAGEILFGDDREKIKQFGAIKTDYVGAHLDKISVFEGFFETVAALQEKHIPVWICTSAEKEFVEGVNKMNGRFAEFKDRTVTRDMYKEGKPDPEPLLLTFSKMGINPSDGLYVGDAYSDYMASTNAGCSFVYFCPDMQRDSRIPNEIPTISHHRELLPLLSL